LPNDMAREIAVSTSCSGNSINVIWVMLALRSS